MKKVYLGVTALLLLFVLSTSAVAADGTDLPSKVTVGVGYEGMYLGNYLQGLSVRGWFDRFGIEGSIWQANVSLDLDIPAGAGDTDASIWLLGGKFMFAPILRDHSKFYVGVEGGWGTAGLDIDTGANDMSPSVDGWTVGPMFGAEFFFQEIPELGFNFEVGYRFAFLNADADLGSNDKADLGMNGIWVTAGVHYYFF
ncbi:MAG: hypothetical protein JW955_02900 [Sedimentisphaerales bacterium]|nr:hypothetical protein [Sedimentisphaerales bacterium]